MIKQDNSWGKKNDQESLYFSEYIICLSIYAMFSKNRQLTPFLMLEMLEAKKKKKKKKKKKFKQ